MHTRNSQAPALTRTIRFAPIVMPLCPDEICIRHLSQVLELSKCVSQGTLQVCSFWQQDQHTDHADYTQYMLECVLHVLKSHFPKISP